MNRSAHASTNLQVEPSLFSLLALLIALLAYALPWTIAPSHALSLNAYDLAEWMSIHPSGQTSNPILLVPFLLRLPLACIALLINWTMPTHRFSAAWWCKILGILALSVMLLPPLEFLSDHENLNYIQQFTLTLIAFTGAFWRLLGIKYLKSLTWIVAFIAAAAAMWGTLQASMEMRSLLQVDIQLGAGSVFLTAAFIYIGLLVIIRKP